MGNVSRCLFNYYRWKRNQEKRDGKLLKEKQLIKKIEDIFENSDRTYGYRVIKEELKQIGEEISEYKVRRIMRENGITGSMSKGGCLHDNSCVESFFATLKKERIYRRDYVTIEDVKRDMFRYIELFYNRKRLHSILGYMSPVAYS